MRFCYGALCNLNLKYPYALPVHFFRKVYYFPSYSEPEKLLETRMSFKIFPKFKLKRDLMIYMFVFSKLYGQNGSNLVGINRSNFSTVWDFHNEVKQ